MSDLSAKVSKESYSMMTSYSLTNVYYCVISKHIGCFCKHFRSSLHAILSDNLLPDCRDSRMITEQRTPHTELGRKCTASCTIHYNVEVCASISPKGTLTFYHKAMESLNRIKEIIKLGSNVHCFWKAMRPMVHLSLFICHYIHIHIHIHHVSPLLRNGTGRYDAIIEDVML